MTTEPNVAEHPPAKRWDRNPRLEALFRGRPEVGARLEALLRRPELVAAIRRAIEKDPEELTGELADGFRASFPDLGDRTPTSIETLDFRAHAPDTVDGTGTTGTASDYLMQRLMATTGLADLADAMTLPEALRQSFANEADKLATFLVALDRAKPPAEEGIAA